MMSATASLGMSMLWDSDVGVSQVDKYSYSAEEHIKVITSIAAISSFRSDPTLPLTGRCPACNRYPSCRCERRVGHCLCFVGRARRQQKCSVEDRCHQRVGFTMDWSPSCLGSFT